MNKKTQKVSEFKIKSVFNSSLSVKAFDNSGEGDDPSNTGEVDFSKIIPEEHLEAFNKYKQGLIDKGVDIGTARSKDRFEKNKDKTFSKLLEEKGLTVDALDKYKTLASKETSMSKIFEAYGTEDFDEIAKLIANQEGGSQVEVAEREEELNRKLKDAQSEIEALKNGRSQKEKEVSTKYEELKKLTEQKVVNKELSSLAVSLGAYDATDVVTRVRDFVRLDTVDGELIPVVLDANGEKAFDSDGNAKTMEVLVKEFLDARPHLRKSTAKGGVGGNQSRKPNSPNLALGKFTVEQLNDPVFFQNNYAEIQKELSKRNLKI